VESGLLFRRSGRCCRLAESSAGLLGPGTARRVSRERRRRGVCCWLRGTGVRPSGRRDGERRRAPQSGARPVPQGTAGVPRDLLAGRHGERSERHAEGAPAGGARARPSARREVSATTPHANPLQISVFYVFGAACCARALPEPRPSCARALPEQGWRPSDLLGCVSGARLAKGTGPRSSRATVLVTPAETRCVDGTGGGGATRREGELAFMASDAQRVEASLAQRVAVAGRPRGWLAPELRLRESLQRS